MKSYLFAFALFISGVMTAPAMAAKGLDSSFAAMSKSGSHQFYVWCTGKGDSVQSARGSSAKQAQASLAGKIGNQCHPVWQGLK